MKIEKEHIVKREDVARALGTAATAASRVIEEALGPPWRMNPKKRDLLSLSGEVQSMLRIAFYAELTSR